MRDTSSPAEAGPVPAAGTPAPGSRARLATGRPGAPLPAVLHAEQAWIVFWLLGLAAMVLYPRWALAAFYGIWIGLAVLYGFRAWPLPQTAWLLAAVTLTTGAALGAGVARSSLRPAVVAVVPLTAAMFWAMAWHLRRRMAADAVTGAQNARLLTTQRRFLQDASHQLRTPITIALGHAELLARQLAGDPAQRDIAVVVGELNRLRRLSERLLLIAACENPDFLLEEPVPLEQFAIEVLHRWRPAAARRWQLGQLDLVTVSADRERLGLAVDALLENAVRFTGEGDLIRLSVIRDGFECTARLIVEDAGSGIPAGEVAHIFERFATGPGPGGRRGTGLGLALVLAIARGHGGDVQVHSEAGHGSTFEIVLPAAARDVSDPADGGAGTFPGGWNPAGDRTALPCPAPERRPRPFRGPQVRGGT